MLNEREKIHVCALRAERERCVLLLVACTAAAVGMVALACICRGCGAWDLFGAIAAVDAFVAAAIGLRIRQISLRLRQLEGFADGF